MGERSRVSPADPAQHQTGRVPQLRANDLPDALWAPGALDYKKLGETIVAEWDRALAVARASNLSEAEIRVLRGARESLERGTHQRESEAEV